MRYRCIKCGYETLSYEMKCPRCGYPMEIVLDREEWLLDEEEPSIWRYRSLLPERIRRVSLGEGLTPLKRVGNILIKDETRNPTGSYVDRGSSVLVSCSDLPKEVNMDFTQDVTVSLVTYLLKTGGIKIRVRVDPARVDLTELLYLASSEADISFDGKGGATYESPYMIEGFKTIAFEIFEAKGEVSGIVIPAESGVLAYGIWKGFAELEELGLSKIPRVYLAFHGGEVTGLLELLEDRGAKLVEVSAAKALESLIQLAKRGVYVKPVTAKAYSLARELGSDVVAVITGTGIRKWVYSTKRPFTELQLKIVEVLRQEGEMTAYKIWKKLEGASLQGVYKALSKLTEAGLVSSKQVMVKRRKIRLYRVIGNDGSDGSKGKAEGGSHRFR